MSLTIQSHKGPYTVALRTDVPDVLSDVRAAAGARRCHFIVDERLAGLHGSALRGVLQSESSLPLAATEQNKSLDRFTAYAEHLVARGVRRGDILVAIGGGIIQDVTCFLASTLLRGLDWHFYPTTLLAQADSCIGSKSSINVGSAKNLMGTFLPPKRIVIATDFLKTLEERDFRSGVGEMLKVHVIDGPASFDQIAAKYESLFSDPQSLAHFIRRSLEIKKRIIEVDEFDAGPRNVMNYGHSFGHAIESATEFAIPHGIAVTMGMDLANFYAVKSGRMAEAHFDRMHDVLARNARGFAKVPVPMDRLLAAISKDKKNTGDKLTLILPDGEARVGAVSVAKDSFFVETCGEFLARRKI